MSTTKQPNPWYVGVVSGMASYIDSAAIVSNGTALVIYQKTIGTTSAQIGILSGILTLSIALGAFLGGRLGDCYGRRKVFIVTMAMIIIGTLLLAFGNTFPVLLTGTLLVGLATGADLPVSLATIAEAATDKNRGKIIGLSNLLWFLGIGTTMAISAMVGDWGRARCADYVSACLRGGRRSAGVALYDPGVAFMADCPKRTACRHCHGACAESVV